MKKLSVLFLLAALTCSLAIAAPQLGINAGYGGRGFNWKYDNDNRLNMSSGGFKISADVYFPFHPDDNYSTVTGGIDVELDSLFALNIRKNGKVGGIDFNSGITTYKSLIGAAVVPNVYLAALAMGQAKINDVFQFNFGGGLLGGYSSYRLNKIQNETPFLPFSYEYKKNGGFAWGLRFRLGFIFNVSETVAINLLGTFDNYFYDANVGWEFGTKNIYGKSTFIYGLDAKAGVTIKF